MSELGEDGPFYDQTDQRVDTQFNAESINVVYRIAEGERGKRCPACNAAPMRRTRIVWEDNTTRRAGGGTLLRNYLAERVAPPRRPQPVDNGRSPVLSSLLLFGGLVAAGVLIYCCGSLGISIYETPVRRLTVLENAAGLLLLVWTAAAAFLSYRGYKVFTARAATHRDRLSRYERDRERWRQSWFCGACGTLAVEETSSR